MDFKLQGYGSSAQHHPVERHAHQNAAAGKRLRPTAGGAHLRRPLARYSLDDEVPIVIFEVMEHDGYFLVFSIFLAFL